VLTTLDPGYYLLYEKNDDLHILSSDGKEDIKFITGREDGDGIGYRSNLYDGKVISILATKNRTGQTINLDTKAITGIPDLSSNEHTENCSLAVDSLKQVILSPNQEWLSFLCPIDSHSYNFNLSLENIKTGKIITFPNTCNTNGKFENYLDWSWSPDNHWFIYYQTLFESLPEYEKEMMVVDTSCLDTPDLCPLTQFGPFTTPKYALGPAGPSTWSPDSRYFVSTINWSGFPLVEFDLQTRTFNYLDAGGTYRNTWGLAWSPDGHWIAFMVPPENDILLLNVKDDTAHQIFKGSADSIVLVGWLSTFSDPVFEIGSKLLVTGAGNQVRLRQSPSLSGEIVRYLEAGSKIELIDGPTIMDEQRWWKVVIESDQKAGWVIENEDWYAMTP
jgi:WD40 repeat protein